MTATPRPWLIMKDGPKGDGEPYQFPMEAAPGLTIASPANTEFIARLNGYGHDVKANAAFILHAVNTFDEAKAALRAALTCIMAHGVTTWEREPLTDNLRAVLAKME